MTELYLKQLWEAVTFLAGFLVKVGIYGILALGVVAVVVSTFRMATGQG